MENQPLNWILSELAFAKNSDKLSEEISSYCAMLEEGLLYNMSKVETAS